MLCLHQLRRIFAATALCACAGMAAAQTSPATSPASLPAGVLAAPPPAPEKPPSPQPALSPKQLREADDAYLEGSRQLQRKDLAAALASFQRAASLNPRNRDYALALIVTRDHRVTEIIQQAAKARLAGNEKRADQLLEDARKLDPDNPVVLQHFGQAAAPPPHSLDPAALRADQIASTLGSPVELDHLPGEHSFHFSADARSILRDVYRAFGIDAVFDPSFNSVGALQIDLDDVDFADATRIILQITHTIAVPLQAKQVLIARDNPDSRQLLVPQVEETIYLPGYSQDQMTELANVARNVFDFKQVTASATGGFMLVRGDEDSLKLLNATYADMLDGGTDVLFDINLYEIDTTKVRNIGATLPSSVSGFDLLNSAQTLITANQSLINQATASGLLTLNGTTGQNEIAELVFLVAAGVSGASQFTNLLGVLGSYNGLPLAGISIATGTTFNIMLNSTDARTLDAIQLRVGNGQPANFRAGSRYPVITGTYSSGISSSLASQLSGLNVNGTSVSKLLSQYLGGTNVSVPQFQFEDLGITLKLTPHVQHGSDVNVAVDMKIEALGGTSINNVPILNNRALTSTLTIPAGRTAMLATLVSRNELRSIDGVPGLSELPGFQGTEQDKEFDSDELVITITPHVVRSVPMHIVSRPLLAVHTTPAQ